MAVDVKNGQKTGYFLDQKENRFAVSRYAKGGRVLDCFSNSGGFALNAALTADRVIAADISPLALENVEKNARLNGISNLETKCGDVFQLLREYRKTGEKFSLIVLDPPRSARAPTRLKTLSAAIRTSIFSEKLVQKRRFFSHVFLLPLHDPAPI